MISVGDLNKALGSFNSLFDSIRDNNPDSCSGKIRTVPPGYLDGEVELLWTIDRFGLGVAVSAPMRKHHTSNLIYTIDDYAGIQINDYTFDSEVRGSSPAKLYLYYSFPLSPIFNLRINSGLGYYKAKLKYDKLSHVQTVIGGTIDEERLINCSGNSLGFHLGFGLEYSLNHHLSFLFASEWRYCRIKSLQGDVLSTAFADGVELYSIPNEGYLYHTVEEDFTTGYRYAVLNVWPTPPEGGIGFPTEIRKAFLDLGGFSFRIGVKVGLF